jgi:hypothetical protein
MAPLAMEMFTRSRYETALRINSQHTRNQRTWLVLAVVISDLVGREKLNKVFVEKLRKLLGNDFVLSGLQHE